MRATSADVVSHASPAADLAKPFAWLAALAFLLGFIGYLVLAAPVVAHASDAPTAARAISGPLSADWNLRKAI